MAASPFVKIAKFLYLPALTAGMLLASPGIGNASLPVRPAHTLLLSSAGNGASPGMGSVFAMEQAMGPAKLVERWTPFIKEASRRFGVAETWIKAVMRMESGGRTVLDDKQITSKAGAMGVMQVMPGTYNEMRQQYGLGADPYDPHDNVLAGAAYLRWLYGKYGYPKMFAAYNAGPGTVETARELPNETRAYVSGIARILGINLESANLARVSATYQPAPPRSTIATLTRPDGSSVEIDGATVDSIREAMPNEYAPGVRTVLAMGKKRQGVTEDMATVASLIRGDGGNA